MANTLEHENTGLNKKSVQKVSRQNPSLDTFKRHPKTDARYWQGVVFVPVTKRGETVYQSGHYVIKIAHAGRRESFNLNTANKTVAANTARDIFQSLKVKGWEETLAVYKPKASKNALTVGELIGQIKSAATGRAKTIEGYCRAFRQIVADIHKIDGGREKFDYRGGGREKWLAKVEAVKLETITPARIQAWKKAFLAKAGLDPVAQRAAKISVNSILRNAKSLFSEKMLKFVEVKLPGNPFEGVAFEPRQSMKYRAGFDVDAVIRAALSGDEERGLAPLPDEERKIFLLGLLAGLRRGEIDSLEWDAIHWPEGFVRIEETRFFQPKSQDSCGDVPLDEELLALLRGYHAKARSNFVIESPVTPRPGSSHWHYRCQKHFERLTQWLRKAGVVGNKPLHVLRKEYGSQVAAKHGLYAASFALRHSDTQITSQFYLDQKNKRVTSGLGGLLANVPENVVEGAAFSAVKKPLSETKTRKIGGAK